MLTFLPKGIVTLHAHAKPVHGDARLTDHISDAITDTLQHGCDRSMARKSLRRPLDLISSSRSDSSSAEKRTFSTSGPLQYGPCNTVAALLLRSLSFRSVHFLFIVYYLISSLLLFPISYFSCFFLIFGGECFYSPNTKRRIKVLDPRQPVVVPRCGM